MQVSPRAGMPSPQMDVHTPTSWGQFKQVSSGSIVPSQQRDAGLQTGTSFGQFLQVSPGAGIPSPQIEIHAPTSWGQFKQVSSGSIVPSQQ